MRLKAPFKNESEVLGLGNLSIENRVDRIQISGGIDITKDKQGLLSAKEMLELLLQVIAELKSIELPESISVIAPTKVNNPFK